MVIIIVQVATNPETTARSTPPPPDPPAAYAPAGSSRRRTESHAPPAKSAAHPQNAPANLPNQPTPRQKRALSPPARYFRPKDASDRPPQSPRMRIAGRAAPAPADPPARCVCASASAPAAPSAPAHPKQPHQSASTQHPAQDNDLPSAPPNPQLTPMPLKSTDKESPRNASASYLVAVRKKG